MAADEFGSTSLPESVLQSFQAGSLAGRYRGRPMWKCPIDLMHYMSLIWEIRPRTVIEFGSNRGASALWFADTMDAAGIEDGRVLSFDIEPVTDLPDPRITFAHCDVANPLASIDRNGLRDLPKPWLVNDDALELPPDSGVCVDSMTLAYCSRIRSRLVPVSGNRGLNDDVVYYTILRSRRTLQVLIDQQISKNIGRSIHA